MRHSRSRMASPLKLRTPLAIPAVALCLALAVVGGCTSPVAPVAEGMEPPPPPPGAGPSPAMPGGAPSPAPPVASDARPAAPDTRAPDASASPDPADGAVAAGASDELYDPERVPRFDLELPPASVTALGAESRGPTCAAPSATASETVADVGVRLKGEATFRPLTAEGPLQDQVRRVRARPELPRPAPHDPQQHARRPVLPGRAAGLPRVPRRRAARAARQQRRWSTSTACSTASTPTSRPRTRPSCAAGSPATTATSTKRGRWTSSPATRRASSSRPTSSATTAPTCAA